VAASALAVGYDVLPFNVGEFERVPGLTVRLPDWSSDSPTHAATMKTARLFPLNWDRAAPPIRRRLAAHDGQGA
jgi:hypothetical protein